MLMRPILRSAEPAHRNVEEAIRADRRWFDEHPDEDRYIREFVPGEFPELPPVPPGFHRATLVTVMGRDGQGGAFWRKREPMAVIEDIERILEEED